MAFSTELLPASASAVNPLQLKNVYDIAQSVGEQFQVLIERFGNSHLATLIDTVVNVLEHLEVFVEENQKLQARKCQLLLENDNLLKELEELKRECQKNAVTLATLEGERAENKQLVLELKFLRESKKELQRQIEEDRIKHQLDKSGEEVDEENSSDQQVPSTPSASKDQVSTQDVMELPRMKRRLAQMENELKRTRTKLLSAQSTLKGIVSENSVLKSQLEETKAEIGLKTLQLTHSEHVQYAPNQQESPKFYKKDLLVILKERNELKEELDSVREELSLAKLQLRYQQHPWDDNIEQNGVSTKVRSIVTSMTAETIKKK